MFDLEAQIKEWRAELARTGLNARKVVDELEGHLREQVQRLVVSGFPEPKAFQIAARQLGDGKSLKTEFSKLRRYYPRIFRDNPLGVNVLGVWLIVIGLNSMVWPLRYWSLCFLDFTNEILHDYSFKGGRLTLPDGFNLSSGITGALLILLGIGLLRRWKICRMVTLVIALPQIYFGFLYFVLGHPIPDSLTIPLAAYAVVHAMSLGMLLSYGYIRVNSCVCLAILIWGVCSLLRPWAEKRFRRAVAG